MGSRKAFGDDYEGNPDKDRRADKIRRDRERKRDKFEKGSRRRQPVVDHDEELDFGWN